ncbi:hypothetical protein [Helicobacter pylori]|uniref:hypothetical protein n=1 Tax=Helicobacter pylori TaxID=210 RepID=UPI0006ADECF6|nr:hypothetical protein [Helicobacter pylori]KOS35946.1 hypothetical protein AM498_00420 [Helicobacter pylori]
MSQRATPSFQIQRPPAQRRFIKDFRECHLKPDLLLVYQIKKQENTLVQIYKAINKLSQIEWFKKSVRDIRAFKVEDFSDFTEIVKS